MSAPEPVVVYMTTGGTFRKHAHGAKVWTEGRWLPARAYAALLARLNEAEARANTATVLLKEARRYVEDNIAGRFVPSNGDAATLLSRIDAALKRDGEG